MRAIGVNRRPADNRLAAAVPTARRKVDALGGTVLRTATDQRRAVKAPRSGPLTEAVAPAPGAVRHAGAGRGTRARPCRCLRPAADPSLPQPGPLLDRGLDAAEPHIRSPPAAAAPRFPVPEGVRPGRAGPICNAASRSQGLSLPWLDGHLRKVGSTSTGSGGWRRSASGGG